MNQLHPTASFHVSHLQVLRLGALTTIAALWTSVLCGEHSGSELAVSAAQPTIEVVPQQESLGPGLESANSEPDTYSVKPLREIALDIRVTGETPPMVVAPQYAGVAVVGGRETQRGFGETVYFWQASNLVHHPLYFEQRYVERYGASFGTLQPVASGVQMAADTALLPLKMLRHSPRECVYSLGYGRPGDTGTRCPRN